MSAAVRRLMTMREMPVIGIEVPLGEFYEGVAFQRTDTREI